MDALFFAIAVVTIAAGPVFIVLYSMQTKSDIEYLKNVYNRIKNKTKLIKFNRKFKVCYWKWRKIQTELYEYNHEKGYY